LTNKDLIKPSNHATSSLSEQALTSKQIGSNKQKDEVWTKDYLKSKRETAKR